MRQQHEIIIVGGGVTGAAIGYGLAKQGKDVAIIDDTPPVDRASRSNMGLIWVQSKGLNCPEYAHWGFESSDLFAPLAAELLETSGIDIEYSDCGGIIPCVGEEEFERRGKYLSDLRELLGDYPGGMISRDEFQQKFPKVKLGPKVAGAAWCTKDGLVEPLQLMFALRKGFINMGGKIINDCRVTKLKHEEGVYRLTTGQGEMECDRIVLAGGLGNRQLASHFDCKVPVTPDRGQVYLTERVGDIFPCPMLGICRTPGGTVMVGFMHEHMGTDVGFVPESVAKEACWSVDVWPDIAKLRVIRCWSSLRVMPRDGFPIYDRIPGHEKAFLINMHSAVTLTGVNEKYLPDFVMGKELPEVARIFNLARFDDK